MASPASGGHIVCIKGQGEGCIRVRHFGGYGLSLGDCREGVFLVLMSLVILLLRGEICLVWLKLGLSL